MSGDRLFQGGPDAHSMDLGFGPDPQPEQQDNQEPATGGVHLTAEQFQELIGRIGQQYQERDYAAAISGQEPPPLPEIDLSQLPDPARDPEGFKAGLTQVLVVGRDQIMGQAQAQANAAQQTQRTLDEAWSLMRERYPEIAPHEDIIGMAAQREMDELRSQGIDPLSALSQNMEQAVDRIAERASATVNRIKGFQQDGSGNDYARTDMIGGGSPRPGSRQSEREKLANFLDELKAEQRRLRIY